MKQNITQSGKAPEIVSPDTGLTALQEKGAILLASGIRISDVAKELGTSRGTLYRWQNQVAFQCFYNLMKQDVKNYMEGSVLELHTQALEGIKASLSSCNEAIKLRASMWVIEKISQMAVGQTDVRSALKFQSNLSERWDSDKRYREALEDAGLEA